jgi:hypothetical protein
VGIPSTCAGVTCFETINDIFGPATYAVLGPNGSYPLNGTWTANSASSQWIGPRADQTNPQVGGTTLPATEIFPSNDSPYVYRIVFNLSALGVVPTTANMSLQWASDWGPGSEIRLCSAAEAVCPGGSAITGSGSGGPSGFADVNLVHGVNNANFIAGPMALDFVIFNPVVSSGANPSGLRVNFVSAFANTDPPPTSPVPEPTSFGLLGLGLAAVMVRMQSVRNRR